MLDVTIDLTGKRFGRLLVLGRDETKAKDGHGRWMCQCDCGNTVSVRSNNLASGHTKSCGCYKLMRTTKHGQSKSRLYNIFNKMVSRCYDEKFKQYNDYGGRGIRVCDEWLYSFQSFYEWAIANGYSDELTIDRINVNGDYAPNNCRWSTRKVQSNNTRRNVYYTYNRKTKTIAEWSAVTGINYNTLRARLQRYGWSIGKALSGGKHDEI